MRSRSSKTASRRAWRCKRAFSTATPAQAPMAVSILTSRSSKGLSSRLATLITPTTVPCAVSGIQAKHLNPAVTTAWRKKRRSFFKSLVTSGCPDWATSPMKPSPIRKRSRLVNASAKFPRCSARRISFSLSSRRKISPASTSRYCITRLKVWLIISSVSNEPANAVAMSLISDRSWLRSAKATSRSSKSSYKRALLMAMAA